ncbi:hypothetical protein KGP36_05425 [Patescibacteria group bacterium]|nr:hypothetical protein [Patescibacteria group bacterium]MDE1941290.1 hypothetical protein [Patescibacteria group bacterium]
MKSTNWWKVLSTFNLSFSVLIGLLSLWIIGLENNYGGPASSDLVADAMLAISIIGFISSFYTRKEILIAKRIGLVIAALYVILILIAISRSISFAML